MILLWTKSTLPLSVVIRAVTGDDCSHFSIVLYDSSKVPSPIVFESNLLGTHPLFLQTALTTHTVVHQLTISLTEEQEDKILDAIISKFDGKPYDFGGALYLGWRKLMNRIFKTPLPAHNKWSNNDAYFCDEIYQCLESAGLPDFGISTGMETPHDLWLKLKDWQIAS